MIPVVGLRDAHEVEVVGEGPGEAERVVQGHCGQVGLQLPLDDGSRVLHPRRAHGDGALVHGAAGRSYRSCTDPINDDPQIIYLSVNTRTTYTARMMMRSIAMRRQGKCTYLREDAVALEDVDEAGAELAEEDVVEEAGEEAAVVLERLERYPLRDVVRRVQHPDRSPTYSSSSSSFSSRSIDQWAMN
jgi:hypothetical protein